MEEIVPLFKSHCSLGRSILTLEKPKDEADTETSDSVFDIVKQENLEDVFLVEDNMTGFFRPTQTQKNLELN